MPNNVVYVLLPQCNSIVWLPIFFHKSNLCRFFPINFTSLFKFLFNSFWRFEFFFKHLLQRFIFPLPFHSVKHHIHFHFQRIVFCSIFTRKCHLMRSYQNIASIYKQDDPSNCKHLQNKILIFSSFTKVQNYKINFLYVYIYIYI